MFKDYKEILKSAQCTGTALEGLHGRFSGNFVSEQYERPAETDLESLNSMVEQAINQSLELQQKWLEQWSERAGGKKIKPKRLPSSAPKPGDSTQHWLDNQNKLLEQWLQVLNGTVPAARPDFAEWEKRVQDSMQLQMTLLNDWLDMADFKKLFNKRDKQSLRSDQQVDAENHRNPAADLGSVV